MKTCRLVFIFLLGGNLIAAEPYEEPPITKKDRQHWAFQPIRTDRVGTIDSFLLEKLKESGIKNFAPEADEATLLRRLYFDVIGLPPTPDEAASFSTDKIETVIDELLSRPQYGEHWAQYWLDVARFAETDGFEHDKIRPDAWRYRDWVIGALNADLPYDLFVAHQIAGDEIAPDDHNAKLATGFLFSGPDMPDINLEAERRHNVLNETTATVGAAFLGLSMGCAQCHDHKFDPISQAEFYRLRSFFDNAKLPPKDHSLPHIFSEAGPEPILKSVVRIRGDFRRAGVEVKPDFLQVVNLTGQKSAPVATATTSGRRADLANWLRNPKNPLVARVIVNRVWQQHFGAGLIATPNDFGKMGDRPTHPELLDWLAANLIDHGWSLKQLHREILLSQAWRQASRYTEIDPEWDNRIMADPDNHLYSRRNRTRLSGEAIRDSILQITGRLNLKRGGPGFRPPLPDEVTGTLLKGQWTVSADESEHYRRSIYLFARRNLRYPLFEVFDRPDGNESCARRHTSTTAPQSLILLNSEFSDERARDLSSNLMQVDTVEEQVTKAYQQVLGRVPSADEINLSRKFIQSTTLADFALAMFNLNEFVFID